VAWPLVARAQHGPIQVIADPSVPTEDGDRPLTSAVRRRLSEHGLPARIAPRSQPPLASRPIAAIAKPRNARSTRPNRPRHCAPRRFFQTRTVAWARARISTEGVRSTAMLSFCGIDVSKDRLDVMVLPGQQID
jgi:hypothetical protein